MTENFFTKRELIAALRGETPLSLDLRVAIIGHLQPPANAEVVTDEMVERAFVAHTAAKGMRLDPGAKYTANKLHMRTALEAALAAPKPEAVGDQCDKCHRRYTAVYNVPNDLWTKIAPKPETLGDYPEHQYGGLLCPDCATDAAKALGVELVLVTQPPTPASGEQMEVVAHPLEAYADSYAQMSRMGDGKVDCRSVEVDIRQNMIPATQNAITAANERAERLKKWESQASQSAAHWKIACFDAERKLETAEALNTTLSEALADAPITPPLRESEIDQAWVQLLLLFQSHNHPEPPIRLRDELVNFMVWAWYGHKAYTALAALPDKSKGEKDVHD